MSTKILKFELFVKTPPSQVYQAFTNATLLKEWCCDVATVDPKPGGRFYMAWNEGFYTSGEYTALEKDKSLAFTWFGRTDPARTKIDVTLLESEDGTQVTLVHNDIGTGPEWEATVQEFNTGWENSLKNLVSVLETGEDLRFVMRPMLGITLTDFNEEIAKQLGVPITKGIRIDGTVEGMGAQVAGLEKDDVIVSMNGKPADDFPLLTSALSGLRAGDTTEVIFYRGPEKKTVMMELSRRPIPEIPDTTAELSQALEKKYMEVEPQLNDFLDGITEEDANYKPSTDDWSVKEVLAHLIQGERFYHFYIAELVGGQERWSDDYAGNLEASIEATVASYPSLYDLREALKRARVETVLLIAKLPVEFVDRKGSYWRLAYGALEGTFHDVAHIEQMKTAVEASRAQ